MAAVRKKADQAAALDILGIPQIGQHIFLFFWQVQQLGFPVRLKALLLRGDHPHIAPVQLQHLGRK